MEVESKRVRWLWELIKLFQVQVETRSMKNQCHAKLD